MATILLASERAVPPWLLVPVFWVWVNSHGSFPLGLVLIALLWAGTRLDGQDASREQRLGLYALAGTLSGVLSPLGLEALTFPVQLLGRSDVLENVVEWKSPSFTDLWTRVFLVQLALGVLALVRKPSYRAALPLIAFTAAGLVASRNLSTASLVLLPGTAYGLAGIGHLTGREIRGLVPGVGTAFLGLVSALFVVQGMRGEAWNFDLYPVSALAVASEEGLLEPPQHVAMPDFAGNLRIGIFGTDANVFLDDRFDLYPVAVMDDYRELADGGPGWGDVLDRYDIDTVIWGRDEPIASLLSASPAWRTAFQDDGWVLFVRR
jgi:hypothetical protein